MRVANIISGYSTVHFSHEACARLQHGTPQYIVHPEENIPGYGMVHFSLKGCTRVQQKIPSAASFHPHHMLDQGTAWYVRFKQAPCP